MDTDLHQIIRSDQQLTDDHCQVWEQKCQWGFMHVFTNIYINSQHISGLLHCLLHTQGDILLLSPFSHGFLSRTFHKWCLMSMKFCFYKRLMESYDTNPASSDQIDVDRRVFFFFLQKEKLREKKTKISASKLLNCYK